MNNPFPIKRFEQLGTPFYYYDLCLLDHSIAEVKRWISKYGFHMHYALKANSNEPILKKMLQAGFGADCVSGNEVLKSLEIGFKPEQIAFAGVGKTDEEIMIGLENNIFSFNVESINELAVIHELATKHNQKANIALRINPNVDAKTHHYITTGIEENKFGINPWEFSEVLDYINKSNLLKLKGLHFHIGSQITDLDVFKSLCNRVNEIQHWFWDHRIIPEHINLGGGLGINYHNPAELPDFNLFFKIFADHLELRRNQQVHFELGRSLVAPSGSLISRVLYVKKGIKTQFAILDAGMTELIRPALYQSVHSIQNLTSINDLELYDVVGPICESSDCFGKAISLPKTQRGDIIAIRSTGAYGEVMRSNYNLRSTAPAYYSHEIQEHE